jgi:hypothetical protein
MGGGRNQRHGRSAAEPVPSLLSPLGGGEGRQGAASVRARCRADGGPENGLAAQPFAGAVQRRRRISRCTDRSAGGCADRHTFVAVRARAIVRRPQRSTSGWQRRRGQRRATAWADRGGQHCAGASARRRGCPHTLGKTARLSRRTPAASEAWASCLLGKHGEEWGKGPTGLMTQTELEARLRAVETALKALEHRLAALPAHLALARRDHRVVQRCTSI